MQTDLALLVRALITSAIQSKQREHHLLEATYSFQMHGMETMKKYKTKTNSSKTKLIFIEMSYIFTWAGSDFTLDFQWFLISKRCQGIFYFVTSSLRLLIKPLPSFLPRQ